MKILLNKAQWKHIGKTAGWITAQDEDEFIDDSLVEINMDTTPVDEPCAQVGSNNYDATALSKMEIRAYINQLQRMFPDMPEGVTFKANRNPHDFGTYYDIVIQYRGSDEQAAEYVMNIERNRPLNWDETAKEELSRKGYFVELNKGAEELR